MRRVPKLGHAALAVFVRWQIVSMTVPEEPHVVPSMPSSEIDRIRPRAKPAGGTLGTWYHGPHHRNLWLLPAGQPERL
jgi:hypothetical protein